MQETGRDAAGPLLPPRTRARALQRALQGLSLLCFIGLLGLAAFPLHSILPVVLFLRLDPLLAVGVPLAAKAWEPLLWPGLGLLALALMLGRVFCGYVCPLGTCLDLCHRRKNKPLFRHGHQPAPPRRHRLALVLTMLPGSTRLTTWLQGSQWHGTLRFVLLALLLAAAALGLNIFFWASPLALATALFAFFLHPLLLLAGSAGLALLALSPDASLWGMTPDLSLLQISLRAYASPWLAALLLGLILSLEYVQARFWCRFLCPAGSLLALFSHRALWKRRVHTCCHCGLCHKSCPTAAIDPLQPQCTDSTRCITCRTCVDICPTGGTRFALSSHGDCGTKSAEAKTPTQPDQALSHSPQTTVSNSISGPATSRRAFVLATGAGMGLAALTLPGLGTALPQEVLRPPGALPEADFLSRCVRCGLCMKACPSHALHPLWLEAGWPALASPALLPRRGPCEPDCHVCGQLCPSAAIAPLSLPEKQWAKMGTAHVEKQLCVAWQEGKRCMVCQEVCPFGAIDLLRPPHAQPSAPPVPVVQAARCFGCGYCEFHCPVAQRAIRITHAQSLRLPLPLTPTAYAQRGQALGLDLEKGRHGVVEEEALSPHDLPPGFTD